MEAVHPQGAHHDVVHVVSQADTGNSMYGRGCFCTCFDRLQQSKSKQGTSLLASASAAQHVCNAQSVRDTSLKEVSERKAAKHGREEK